MNPLSRGYNGVSPGSFRHNVSSTKALNVIRPMRGGFRL